MKKILYFTILSQQTFNKLEHSNNYPNSIFSHRIRIYNIKNLRDEDEVSSQYAEWFTKRRIQFLLKKGYVSKRIKGMTKQFRVCSIGLFTKRRRKNISNFCGNCEGGLHWVGTNVQMNTIIYSISLVENWS